LRAASGDEGSANDGRGGSSTVDAYHADTAAGRLERPRSRSPGKVHVRVPWVRRITVEFARITVFGLAVACGRAPPPATSPGPAAGSPGQALSNVVRGDYVGSRACEPCHAEIVTAWKRSPMHRMTRDLPDAETDIRAPFDGARVRFKNDSVVLERSGAERLVRVDAAGAPARTYRVTRVIGGRTREDFAGVDVAAGGDEVVLPVSYVLSTRSFRYKGYSVMVHERAGLRAGPVWSQTCIFCHNTVPEIDRLFGPLAGAHAPPYQSEEVDAWLPPAAREHLRVTDAVGFGAAAGAESARLGELLGPSAGPVARTARAAIESVRARFDGSALVEVGIGCEACHGGGRAHIESPRVHPSFVPSAPWLAVDVPGGPAAPVNRACAKCHQVLFSRYPFTWEGGRRDAEAGGSHINSGEARDFLLGACARAMACTACHDPHGDETPAARRALATPEKNTVCTPCHEALGDSSRLRAHSHHDPAGPAGSCIACHMPRKNMGLDGTLTRYHRIGAPTDAARVLGDRPLECALCHVDRSVRSLVDAMEAWWPVRYPRQRLVELYGSLDANVVRATLERGKPHERAVAIALLGEARVADAAPAIARELTGEYPLVREWAKRALVSIRGRCDVDLSAADGDIAEQARACGGGSPAGPELRPPAAVTQPGDPRDEEAED
jgi:predicted CXXCH cytochrome family protein